MTFVGARVVVVGGVLGTVVWRGAFASVVRADSGVLLLAAYRPACLADGPHWQGD